MFQSSSHADLKSYQTALLQVTAYRAVRERVHQGLQESRLSVTQWIILGLLYESEAGYAVSQLAIILNVEGSLVTQQLRSLTGRGLTESSKSNTDKRIRQITLTAAGRKTTESIEQRLSTRLKPLTEGIDPEQLQAYFDTLKLLLHNSL